jgi:hypothetical protein
LPPAAAPDRGQQTDPEDAVVSWQFDLPPAGQELRDTIARGLGQVVSGLKRHQGADDHSPAQHRAPGPDALPDPPDDGG